MRLIQLKFLSPLLAIAAWAQQPAAPASPQEAALRARAEQFFQLQVDKKYRQAESLVASDSKDEYYNSSKYSIKDFNIQKIEFEDGNTRAKVSIKAKVTLVMPGAGAFDLQAPSTSLWKLENGEWVYFIDHAGGVATPFGTMKPLPEGGAPPPLNETGKAPPVSVLQHAVKVDRDSVSLTHEGEVQNVTISNDLPGAVDLELSADQIPGVSSELEKKRLAAGEKGVLRLRATGKQKGAGIVRVFVSPIATELDVSVVAN